VRRVVFAVVVCAAAVLVGTGGAGAAGKVPKLKILHGRVQTDGVLTVGQPETISVSKVFRKFKVLVSVSPPDGAPGCTGSRFCGSEGIPPASGTPAFRTDGKGRATLTFVTPSTYEVFDINHIFSSPTSVNFVNGQNVVIGAGSIRTRHRRFEIASASASAVIEVPSPPPAP
jgi:hypothetical protein